MFVIIYAIVAVSMCGLVAGDCGVVTKKEWGGLQPANVEYLPRPLDLVIIQHTVSPMCKTDASCKDTVQGIQTYHMENLEYWDIGSSFYVGGNGKVYEGCGWLYKGAHTYGNNGRSIGISFIGNFENDQPTTAMLNAVKALLKCGVKKGHLTENYQVVAHRQLIATLSPGRHLYSKIRDWPEWQSDVSGIKG